MGTKQDDRDVRIKGLLNFKNVNEGDERLWMILDFQSIKKTQLISAGEI